jgi:hypothetical protein
VKIKRPDSLFQASTEPLDPNQATEGSGVRGEFADALSQVESALDGGGVLASGTSAGGSSSAIRQALVVIASRSDLSQTEQANKALRESAQFMIRSRLAERYRDSRQSTRLVEGLSEFVVNDPFLKRKLLSILKRIKSE